MRANHIALLVLLLGMGCGEDTSTPTAKEQVAKEPATKKTPESGKGLKKESEHWVTDLPAALAQAKTENKLVLIDFTGSDWCPPCKILHDKVLTQKPFLDHAKQNLVLVMLDFPRSKPQSPELAKANQDLAKQFNVEGFPTLVLLDGGGKELAREVGLAHQNPAEIIAWLKANQSR